MKKLMKMFKSLPPEVRSMLAIAGLGSPIAAIYFAKRFLPRGYPLWKFFLWIVAVVVVIAVIVFVISWLFKRGSKARAKRMEGDLASDAAGPQSMDKSADAKSNNAKFFKAIRDMKKDVGIDVYALPWYITIGDSGCGKTKLINEGGLTFSRGKPEGYQLGTLNYNWWFTEEAIIIDMAGRLCNPRDDSDRREWEGLLTTIGKGRKGFPINGALVCVAADHLLQDPPEKIERDANTVLERLRDLQSRLGVTFATYLMITKCDKILGFMQFFDRADRDIRVKNQMFGWSRPGSFDKAYDPDSFNGAFDDVYARLNELRLRRLNDDSEQIDRGLAHSFPEEFRGLYDPLQIYVSTLFPLIRHAKAVKNLIFRGVYFTSATQEGALILKHLTDRLGQESADQFPPLDDLYPNKRPHFIKDLLLQKVIPEQGLVFRNEQQVVRNRKLNKLLTVATGVLFVVLGSLFWWSSAKFSTLVRAPADDAKLIAEGFSGTTATAAVGQAAKIEVSIQDLKESPTAASVLSGFFHSANEPVVHLQRLRLVLIERAMRDALQSIGKGLSSGSGLTGDSSTDAETYLSALNEYVTWYACRSEGELPDKLTSASFEAMRAVGAPEGMIADDDFLGQVESYFLVNLASEHRRNPSGVMERYDDDLGSWSTLESATERVRTYITKLATLSADHPNPQIRAWMRIRDGCDGAVTSYGDLLDFSDRADRANTVDEFGTLQMDFATSATGFDHSLTACATWDGPRVGDAQNRILTLEQAILAQRQAWLDHLDKLRDSANACGSIDPRLIELIASLTDGIGSKPLDLVYWQSLQDAGVVDRNKQYQPGVFEPETFKDYIHEVYTKYAQVVTFRSGDEEEPADRLALTKDAKQARDRVAALSQRLAGVKIKVPDNLDRETPAMWADAFVKLFAEAEDDADPGRPESAHAPFRAHEFWQESALTVLDETVHGVVRRAEGTQLLQTMYQRLVQINDTEDWGFASLIPEYDLSDRAYNGPYTIRVATGARRRPTTRTATPSVPARRTGPRLPSRGTRQRRPSGARPAQPGLRPQGSGTLDSCATHSFLNDHAQTLFALVYYLSFMDGAFLDDAEQGEERLHERCRKELERAARKYMDRYVAEWSRAYGEQKLKQLERLRLDARDWPQLANRLRSRSERQKLRREFEPALRMILQAVPWATFDVQAGFWGNGDNPWPVIAEWMTDALEQHRSDLGDFAFFARENFRTTGDAEQPWAAITNDFGDAFENLLTAISENGSLDEPNPNAKRIDWDELDKLRDQFQYRDERLTGELVRFVETAQRRFGEHLTDRLARLQDNLGSMPPQLGWPYLPGTELKTVDFEAFKEFLIEVEKTAGAYEKLDVPGTPGYPERTAFFASCKRWHRFLWVDGPSTQNPRMLSATVASHNPKAESAPAIRKGTEPDFGCQYSARWWMLDLGFSQPGPEIRTSCRSLDSDKADRSVEWDWGTMGSRKLKYSIGSPTNLAGDPGPQPLGDHSPLAFCAYLEIGGWSQDRSTWNVSHDMDVDVVQPSAGGLTTTKRTKIGQLLTFRLDRRLPEPIVKLKRLKPSRTEGS